MRLSGAIISDYKSIDAVEVPLGGLTTLFGQNGVGKTNIIEAIGVHDPLARDALRRANGVDRSSRTRVALVMQFDVTADGHGDDAALLLEMLVAPWEAGMDMDEVSGYLGAYCGSTWWMGGSDLADPQKRGSLSTAYAHISEALLIGVPPELRSTAAGLIDLLFGEPLIAVQEDFAVTLSCDRASPKGNHMASLCDRLTGVDDGVLSHVLSVLRSWAGRWPPLTLLSCGPGAEPREQHQALVPAGFRWVTERLGRVYVVSGDTVTVEEHLDSTLVQAHDRLLHRSVPPDDSDFPEVYPGEFCTHCMSPDHGGVVDPAVYDDGTFGSYQGSSDWLEANDEGWIRIRRSLLDILRVIEEEANRQLPVFVTQQGTLRIDLRPVPEWEAAPSRCRIMFDLDPGDALPGPAEWDGPVGVVGHTRSADRRIRRIPVSDLGAGLRRWVATAVRLAADACASGEVTVQVSIDLDPSTPLDEAYRIESVKRPPKRRPRILLVDEPELHLHPLAQHQVAAWALRQAREHHAVVVATHSSAFFGLAPAEVTVCEVKRIAHTTRVQPLRHVHGPDAVQRARELGFDLGLGHDALAQLTRAVAVVEGDWDVRLLRRYFGRELAEQRILLVPLQGSDDFGSLADAAVIPALGVPVVALLDEVRAASAEDLAQLKDPLSKAERALRDVATALGPSLRVVRYPHPDVICALPEDAVRAAYPDAVFPGWDALLGLWETTDKSKPFKRWALQQMGIPSADRKPPTGFFRTVLEHDDGYQPHPKFQTAARRLLCELG